MVILASFLCVKLLEIADEPMACWLPIDSLYPAKFVEESVVPASVVKLQEMATALMCKNNIYIKEKVATYFRR